MWKEFHHLKPLPIPAYKALRLTQRIQLQRNNFWLENPDSTRSLVVGNRSPACRLHVTRDDTSLLFLHTQHIVIPRACEPKYLLLHLLSRGITEPAVFTLLSCDQESSQAHLLVDATSTVVVSALVKTLFEILNGMAKDVDEGKFARGMCMTPFFPPSATAYDVTAADVFTLFSAQILAF